MHRGVTFNFGPVKVCSLAIFETCFSYDKHIWITATDYYMYFYIIVLLILSLLINAVILLLNCLVLILHLYIHFLSLRH